MKKIMIIGNNCTRTLAVELAFIHAELNVLVANDFVMLD